jgi:hypothetical protein
MSKQAYETKRFLGKSLLVIEEANRICAEYARQGYDLTLRQLYYQFIARDLFPDSWIDAEFNRRNGLPENTKNTIRSYKKLGDLVNGGRLAGLIDWDYIVDRTRNLASLSHWNTPGDIIASAAYGYRTDKWRNQPHYIEVWVEKEALSGIIERVASELDVSWFACRGYVSQSEMRQAAVRIQRKARNQCCHIIHLGDHDPSGIDMSRDIADRMRMFGTEVNVNRIALTMEQIEQYNPPPNPAKDTDARFEDYRSLYGEESWELDALDPTSLHALIRTEVSALREDMQWEKDLAAEATQKKSLKIASENWDGIDDWMRLEYSDEFEVDDSEDDETE